MKKFLLALTIILSAIPACAQSLVYGDINGDGKASVSDVTGLVNMILGDEDSPATLSLYIDSGAVVRVVIPPGTASSASSSDMDVLETMLKDTCIFIKGNSPGKASVLLKNDTDVQVAEIGVVVHAPLPSPAARHT